ncbi:MAG: sigma-54-dependent Fis family transcriptional regulator [Ignavibacteriae bacterium]|nr:sigma-54-dependent Fis family transcriptional regulator [Ignavibacteriota bacterium]
MSIKYSILIADDEQSQRLILSGYLKQKGYAIFEAASGTEALKITDANLIDIVLSDFRMPDMNGIELLIKLKERNPEIAVVIVTAFGTIENAVKAMKEGAFDYLTKPVDLDELDMIIKRITERMHLISENKMLKEQLQDKNKISGIVAYSDKMEKILSTALRVAESKATVLLRGESGTGKEVLAKAIHYSSQRKEKPFVAVNCAALNENLLESELFGHEKGAFTGADKQRRGRFEIADGGTLFLDEIGDLPLSTQVKLLRVLQEEQFERVGGTQTIDVDVRMITATNKNLEELIREGKFREDLYYRINVVSVLIPPLRERKEDIIHLINHFKEKYISETSKKNIEFSREATDVLMKYNYPGNIRELENIVHHSIVLSRGDVIATADLPLQLSEFDFNETTLETNVNSALPEQVEILEKKLVVNALKKTNNNQLRASKILGISERNLRYRLEKWGMKNK